MRSGAALRPTSRQVGGFWAVAQRQGRLQGGLGVALDLRRLDASAEKVRPQEFGERRGVFREATRVADFAGQAVFLLDLGVAHGDLGRAQLAQVGLEQVLVAGGAWRPFRA